MRTLRAGAARTQALEEEQLLADDEALILLEAEVLYAFDVYVVQRPALAAAEVMVASIMSQLVTYSSESLYGL